MVILFSSTGIKNLGKSSDRVDAQIYDVARSPQIRFVDNATADDYPLPFGNSDHLPGGCPPVAFNGQIGGLECVGITTECTGVIHLEHRAVSDGSSYQRVLQMER